MKKILSIALVVAMLLGMSSVAFAAGAAGGAGSIYDVDGVWHTFSSDDNWVKNAVAAPAYGNTLYMKLLDPSGADITDADAVKSLSIKQKWDYGKEIIDSIAVVKKKEQGSGYKYWLSIKLKAAPTQTSATDVIGTITLKKSTGDEYAIKPDTAGKNQIELAVNFTVAFASLGAGDNTLATETRRIIKNGVAGVDGEDTLEFADIAYFESDFAGQGKIVVYYDNKYNASVAAKFPAANIDFFNGNYATFNKIGDFTLYADPNTYLYFLAEDGTISKMDAEYDDYEEAFKFRTRTLGRYLVSDMELNLAAAPVSPVVGAPAAGTTAPTEIKTVPVTGV